MTVNSAMQVWFVALSGSVLFLNTAILWLLPSDVPSPKAEASSSCDHESEQSQYKPSPAFVMPAYVEDARSKQSPTTWRGLQMGLRDLDISTLRLLPRAGTTVPIVERRRWLVVGMSSVQRQSTDYLLLTLAHLFRSTAAADLNDMTVAVHLADLDETWVSRETGRLERTFPDHLSAGRLHVLHAPALLYPDPDGWGRAKFNDKPERQKWRSKQNLDYMFLMRYGATLADNYLQLEDDVQVVPNFVRLVRDYVTVLQARQQPWTMVSFSHMGFIGKLFPSAEVLRLSEFLAAFYDQAPCDWLYWNFLDSISLEPITPQIPDDLEREEIERRSPGRHPMPRNDVVIHYTEGNVQLLGELNRAVVSTEAPLGLNAAMPKPQRAMPNPQYFESSQLHPNIGSATKSLRVGTAASLHSQHEDFFHLPLFSGMLAGMCAAIAAWIAVAIGMTQCEQGLTLVGDLPCWLVTYVIVSDMWLVLLLPSSDRSNLMAAFHYDVEPSVPRTIEATSPVIEAVPARSLLGWKSLHFGLRNLDLAALQLLPERDKETAGSPHARWLALGIEVRREKFDHLIRSTLPGLFNTMDSTDQEMCAIVLMLASRDAAWAATAQQQLLATFGSQIVAGLLTVLFVPPHLRPTDEELSVHPMRLLDTQDTKRIRSERNLDSVFLLWFASWRGQFFMEVEDDSTGFSTGFVGKLRQLQEREPSTTWNMMSFSKLGLNRKLLRGGEQLRRLAEFIFMFHDITPRDSLIWDFLDVFQNLAPPKAARLQIDAGERLDKGRRQRVDVVLQHHEVKKSLIEHLGDVSSLKGKVQKIRDPYFKEHRLEDAIFNRPSVSVKTNFEDEGAAQRLKSLYTTASPEFYFQTEDVRRTTLEPWFLELVLDVPAVIDFFLMEMGATLSQNPSELLHVLDDADVEVAYESPGGGCQNYQTVAQIGGREGFVYIGPVTTDKCKSRTYPAKCLRVVVRSAQKNPLIITGLYISTRPDSPTVSVTSMPRPAHVTGQESASARRSAFRGGIVAALGAGVIVRVAGEVTRRSRKNSKKRVAVGRTR